MNIALHGTGRTGSAARRIALERSHEITVEIDSKTLVTASSLSGAEVVIDFSHATALDRLVEAACEAKVDLVIGTTGWNDRLEAIRAKCLDAEIGVVWAPNFSPGATILFAVARRAAELAKEFGGFEGGIEERHHGQKKDAPSGTAIRLAREVERSGLNKPRIGASRVGHEPGKHTLFFDSPDDLIELTHRARNRDGFARGAVIAAEHLHGQKGFLSFEELIGF